MTAGLATAKEISSDPLVAEVSICTQYHFLLSKEYLEKKKETSPAAFLSGEDAYIHHGHTLHTNTWVGGCSQYIYFFESGGCARIKAALKSLRKLHLNAGFFLGSFNIERLGKCDDHDMQQCHCKLKGSCKRSDQQRGTVLNLC